MSNDKYAVLLHFKIFLLTAVGPRMSADSVGPCVAGFTSTVRYVVIDCSATALLIKSRFKRFTCLFIGAFALSVCLGLCLPRMALNSE